MLKGRYVAWDCGGAAGVRCSVQARSRSPLAPRWSIGRNACRDSFPCHDCQIQCIPRPAVEYKWQLAIHFSVSRNSEIMSHVVTCTKFVNSVYFPFLSCGCENCLATGINQLADQRGIKKLQRLHIKYSSSPKCWNAETNLQLTWLHFIDLLLMVCSLAGTIRLLIESDATQVTPHNATVVYCKRYTVICICVVIISFSSFIRKLSLWHY